MVGLIAERRLSKSRRSSLKMSSESTEMVDSEKPLPNGTDDEMLILEKDIKKEVEDGDEMEVVNEKEKSDEIMDVDEKSDDEEKAKKSDDEGDVKKSDDEEKVKKSDDEEKVKKSDDEGKPKSIKQLRKSRSSRSLSSSSSKINTKPSANEGSGSDTEDFHGFDTTEFQSAPRTRLESIQYARLSITGIPSLDVAGSIDTGSVGDPDDSNLDTSKKRRFKASSSVDLSSPDYRKPFEYGWVREIVYRNAGDNGPRRNADVYYHTPTGKKIRSIREILDHLTDGLTERNFTFSKHPIGLEDETKEIIRDAKNKPSFMKDGLTPPPAKKAVQKPKTPSNLTPIPASSSSNLTPKILIKGGPGLGQKPKPKGSKKLDKKDRRTAGGFPDDGDDEIIVLDKDNWSPEKVKTNGLKRRQDSPDNSEPSPPAKRARTSGEEPDGARETTDPEGGRRGEVSPSKGRRSGPVLLNWMNEVSAGFSALLHAFHYLKVFELLRAGCVSKMWQFVASHHSLWESVRMKNSRVSDWNGFAQTLSSRGTKTLDLRKMLVPEGPEELAAMWEEVATALSTIKTLTKVDVGRCSPQAFGRVAAACPHLEALYSTAIKGTGEVDIEPITVCKGLKELKLKTAPNMEFRNLDCLASFENLSTLALTTCKNLSELTRLPETLQSLELGECTSLSVSFTKECLPLLVNLKRLRLEKGQGACPTMELLEAISGQPKLTQLELINFDIKPGFDKAIAKCTNIKTFLVIPTYVTQSATTNHVVMGGVSKLSHNLEYFIWGLTMELLRVTDLFIGQVENQKGKGKELGTSASKKTAVCGDSIPILKPSSTEGDLDGAPSQVDILALPNLQRVLSTLLPTTKIKILKVPFSATWRQVVTDP